MYRRYKGESDFLNSKDYDHQTPLHVAASEGLYLMAKLLTEAGANVFLKDRQAAPYLIFFEEIQPYGSPGLVKFHIKCSVLPFAYNEESCSSQLIDGDGGFNVTGIDSFIKEVKLADCGLSYAVVSIMGPQSSGKNTLLNHLFGTNFREMDAFKGRSQTTKGIWLARCAGIEPCTLVMDLEGTDGRERGEDDTAFEKQSALFALAVSIVLINLWCHDIGREQAANKPLLKTVFQVMMRLFSPRKTTLMFVIRDKTRTPLENLEPVLREDIQKIWDSVPKPQAHIETPLSEFFNVEVVALSSYEEKEEQFKEQVANLRQRFFHSIAPGGLAGDRRGWFLPQGPALRFSFSAQQIWKVIKENKDLDLPAHKVMVATVRCEEIASEKFFSFSGNEDWRELEEAVQSGPISGFGKKLSSVLGTCLSEYDTEATYFDKGVRSAKRKQLEEKLLQLVQPAFQDLLGHLRSGTLDKFKEAFDKALDSGEGFAAAARECTQSYMALFDDEEKLEEELKELKGTTAEMSSETGEAAVQKLQEEIKFCKSILQCLVYRDRPKEKDEEVEDFRMKFAGSQADRIERAEAEAVELAEQLKKK